MKAMNDQLRKMHTVANILIVIASMVLVISYFLPFEGWSWSAYQTAHGYVIAGGYEQGFGVALYNTVPYGLGIVLPLVMVLQRSKTPRLVFIQFRSHRRHGFLQEAAL